jgi:hypothetical protein
VVGSLALNAKLSLLELTPGSPLPLLPAPVLIPASARLLNYWNLHMNELPISSQTRINLLCSNHRGRLFTISTPHQVTRRKARYTVLPENVSHEEGLFTSSANLSVDALAEYPKQRAAITLQNWYRSISITSQAVRKLRQSLAEGEELTVRERRIVAGFETSPVRSILRVLVWSLLVSRTQLNDNITAIVHRQVPLPPLPFPPDLSSADHFHPGRGDLGCLRLLLLQRDLRGDRGPPEGLHSSQ